MTSKKRKKKKYTQADVKAYYIGIGMGLAESNYNSYTNDVNVAPIANLTGKSKSVYQGYAHANRYFNRLTKPKRKR